MNGIIVINKESNMTSHDVVLKARKILKTTKIGHTGTLDPAVTGVLPLCIGDATKLVELLTDKNKEYVCEILLGIQTDTEDFTGNIIDEQVVSEITNELIDETLKKFIGKIEQIPPMYSAIKIKGKRLYDYARENKSVNRPIRIVEVFELERTNSIIDNTFTIRIVCGKGLYVRTLATQIAHYMNTIGCMKSLIRTKAGSFNIENSFSLAQVENNDYHLISINDLLKDYQKLFVKDYLIRLINNGITLDERQIVTNDYFVCYNEFGQMLALYKPVDKNIYKPVIIFKED